jgi:hypothetical protein
VKPRNGKRAAEADARNRGEEGKTVARMACLVPGCHDRAEVCHVIPKSAARGGRFDIVPLCRLHHGEAGEGRSDGRPTSLRTAFEKRHGLDLRAIADRIAIEHSEPLGLRAVAAWWVGCEREGIGASSANVYERVALFGWVRREADRIVGGFMRGWESALASGARPDTDGLSQAARHVRKYMPIILNIEESSIDALLEAAGWAPEVSL